VIEWGTFKMVKRDILTMKLFVFFRELGFRFGGLNFQSFHFVWFMLLGGHGILGSTDEKCRCANLSDEFGSFSHVLWD